MSPEMSPKSFGTFEKRTPGLRSPSFAQLRFFFPHVESVFRQSIIVLRVVSMNIVLNRFLERFELILYIFGLNFYHLVIMSALHGKPWVMLSSPILAWNFFLLIYFA